MCCDICSKKAKKYYEFLTDKCCKECAEKSTSEETKQQKQIWRTANVFTKAPAFGRGAEIKELRIITIRPDETEDQALIREGFDSKESRVQIIDF